MAKFNFYLKGAKNSIEYKRTTKPALILLFGFHQGQRYRLSTGQTVTPKNWNFDSQCVRPSATNAAAINDYLKSVEALAESVLMEFLALGTLPTPEQFKEAFQAERDQKPKSISLSKAFADFIAAKSDSLRYNTLKNYTRNMHRIEEFEAHRGKRVMVETYTGKEHEALIAFLTKHHDHSQNTLADMTKTIKSVLKWVKDEGILPDLTLPSLKVSWEEVPNVYLNESELETLWNLDLKGSEGKERVRDLFLVGCYTGLRYSDFSKLKTEVITGNVAYIQTEKTGALVSVPIHPIVTAILEKYEGKLPNVISNQKMNLHLKDICRLANFGEMGVESKTKGGKKATTIKPKWEMVSTHTARRSFATNIYKMGKLSMAALMKITGHKTEKAFLKYIKMDQEEAANQLAQLWERTYQPQTKLEAV
jgi:integrase